MIRAVLKGTARYIFSTTPARGPTRVALHACAVPHQRIVLALAAGVTFVAPGFGLGAALEGRLLGDNFTSGSFFSAVAPAASARAPLEPAKAVTLDEATFAPCATDEPTTDSLSERERVRPLETKFGAGRPSSTPLPSASKPPWLGST
jgi:hypothetical protein